MKPNFALNLSLDGIDLFHRSKTGWSHVGTVALDDPDLGASLAMMRATAVSLAAGSLTTKVIIPETQILYTEIEAGPAAATPAARDVAIRAALEGRTPYPVGELVFDARPKGRKVELAVLARETLAEAEAFARDHRFNPVSFVAAPAGGRFGGTEPFFGVAASAADTLKTLGEPEREAEALNLDALKRVRPQDVAVAPADAVPAAAPEAALEVPPAPVEAELKTPTFTSRRATRQPARAERQAATAETPQAEAPKPTVEATPVEAAAPPPDEAAPVVPAPAAPVAERPAPRLVASKPDLPPQPSRPAVSSEPVPIRRSSPLRTPADAPVAVKAFLRNQPAVTRKTPVIDLGNLRALKGPAGAAAPALQLAPDPEFEAEVPDAETPRTVFGARREAVRGRSPMPVMALTLGLLLLLAALALWSTFWQESGDPVEAGLAPTGDTLAPVPEVDVPAPEAEEESDLAALGEPEGAPDTAVVVPEEPVDVAPGTVEAAIEPQPAPDPALPEDPAAAALDRAQAGRALPADAAEVLPETAADPEGVLPDASAAATEVELTAPAVAEAAPVEEEALADGEAEVAATTPVPDMPALPSDPVTELVATDEGAADRVREQLAAELTPELADRIYTDTGLWVMAPGAPADPGEERSDDIQIAAIDLDIAGQDAVALPSLSPDRSILPPLSPAPAGTRFDFDERGLVRATPDGAMNPDGIMVYQGRPPVAPAPRDAAAAPAVPEAPADPALSVPENPLSGFRPRPRPADLSETTERALLRGRTLADLSQIKPRGRPAAVLAAATAPEGEAVVVAAASELAVARSLSPQRRTDEIVALASASRAMAVRPVVEAPAEPPPAAAKPAAPAPESDVAEADAEVEVAAAAVVAPSIPTKAGVAKTATVANAINLSKINLIGVYGTQSQRRALVRLSGGKYVKVKVGDRIDGGKVAAISDSSLVYVKGGNQVKLSLPKT
jgi:type IV pilus biogenesis protein PilP